VATERILRKYSLHMSIEPIETAPHVDRSERHKNACCRRQAQHRGSLSSRARSLTGSASRQRTVSPDGATTSMAQGLFGSVAGGTSMTSLNTTGTGKFKDRFAFFSHQLRVASGIPYCREKAARVRPLRRKSSTICSRCAAVARCCCRGIDLISMPSAYRIPRNRGRCTPLTAYPVTHENIGSGALDHHKSQLSRRISQGL
jgi:hypothetical protein